MIKILIYDKYTEEYYNVIPVKNVEKLIKRIDYDIAKTKKRIHENRIINGSFELNDYQITRLKAMNTKSLDIKKRLQQLIKENTEEE